MSLSASTLHWRSVRCSTRWTAMVMATVSRTADEEAGVEEGTGTGDVMGRARQGDEHGYGDEHTGVTGIGYIGV